uniref:Uncharacterized protein n=1 Tax=Geoglobus ahangari TaxID=113653 RepID=A0A7C4S590_9EURY
MDERLIGLSLIVAGLLLILAGAIIYSLPLKEWKENPLIFVPLRKNGLLIGISPILFLILLAFYLLLLFYLKS